MSSHICLCYNTFSECEQFLTALTYLKKYRKLNDSSQVNDEYDIIQTAKILLSLKVDKRVSFTPDTHFKICKKRKRIFKRNMPMKMCLNNKHKIKSYNMNCRLCSMGL